jgi:hypothetical protein
MNTAQGAGQRCRGSSGGLPSLARTLLVSLWRFLVQGLVPGDAALKPA